MKIENLKQNRCPRCGTDLTWNTTEEVLECENKRCDFYLTEDQFTDYIDEIEDKEYHIPTYEENLDRLNKL